MFVALEGKNYVSNYYRYTLYDKNKELYLVTVDDGAFIFLNKSAFLQLKKGKIVDEEIYSKLLNKGIIINSSNFDNVVEKTKKRYSFLDNGTSLHIVIPTSRCNLKCRYCFAEPQEINASKDKYDMTPQIAKKTVDFIFKSPSEAVTIEFTGGEPLARFDILQIMCNYAKELNKERKKDLCLTVVTNLNLMTDEIAKWLIENDVTICTSFDGPEELHNKMRVIEGANGKKIGTYQSVVGWIKKINLLYEEKGIDRRVNALMTITKHSFKYYREIIDEYVKLGIKIVDIRSLMFVGRALYESSKSYYYSQEEFFDFYKKSLEYIEELKKKGVDIEDRMKEEYEIKVLEQRPTYHIDYESPAGAAIGSLTYYSDGKIYAAHEALGQEEFLLGNINMKWSEIFKNKNTSFVVLSSMIESNVICDRCVYKPYCGTSSVENYYALGKFHFYPTKTAKHHETLFHTKRIFDEIVKEI